MALPPDSGDPVSNAVVSPEASLFLRHILESAIAAHPAATAAMPIWMAKAQALLANVMMNDFLNRWNPDCRVNLEEVQTKYVTPAMSASDPAVLALVRHAQALIHRARGNEHNQALRKFEKAIGHDPGFARAHAQFGNQMIICGHDTTAARASVQYAIDLNEHHPARGYFYWAMGRSYVQDKNWDAAVRWLCRSVKALPTVWYNRCYLAYAQHMAKEDKEAEETMRKFRDELRSADELLERVVPTLKADTNSTIKKIGEWLHDHRNANSTAR